MNFEPHEKRPVYSIKNSEDILVKRGPREKHAGRTTAWKIGLRRQAERVSVWPSVTLSNAVDVHHMYLYLNVNQLKLN